MLMGRLLCRSLLETRINQNPRLNKHLAIIGAGGHAHVVADAAIASGHWTNCSFYDDNVTNDDKAVRWPVKGTIDDILSKQKLPADSYIVAIGSNQDRLEIFRELAKKSWAIATIIHPFTSIASDCELGSGTVVFAGAVVNTRTTIGAACILNTQCSVDHDCLVGDGVHISPNVALAGDVTIHDSVWVGIGASVKEGVTIGKGTVVGSGSNVVGNLQPQSVAFGNPARIQ